MLPTFEVFGLSIPMYGVMMLCGMLAAFILLWFTKRTIPFTEDQIYSAALWSIILGLLGAKILFWIVEIDKVIANPHYLLETLREGFVFYGSLIGGILGMFIYSRRSKLPFFAFMDLFIPSLALGQAFGRIGCFCAGCCYGSPSHAFCAVTFPAGGAAPAGVPLLPTQLFESAFLFVLTVVLVLILKRKKPFGTVTGWYLVLYGVWRFIIEFFRSDERGSVGSLSTSQFIGIFVVLAGIVLLLIVKKGILKTASLPEDTVKAAAKEQQEDELFEDFAQTLTPHKEKSEEAEPASTPPASEEPAADAQEKPTQEQDSEKQA
jgi:phosphatidylglycerol:prolipoprotein diacylglycerol transferase